VAVPPRGREDELLDIGRLVAAGGVRPMAEEVRAAYDAPFPEELAKAGARAMPGLVPTRPDDPASEATLAAWGVLSACELPFLLPFSDVGPITGAMAPSCESSSPAPEASAIQPSTTPATSCKRTPERSWAGSSQTSCELTRSTGSRE